MKDDVEMPSESLEVSIVIPSYNEESNLSDLLTGVLKEMSGLGKDFEIVVTDDGSVDQSWLILKQFALKDKRVRIQRLHTRCGQSVATWAGVLVCRGKYIVTLDADLQNDIQDISKLLSFLPRYDFVCGSRAKSRSLGDSRRRIASSKIANWLRNKLLVGNFSDSGCSLRAFKGECIQKIKFFKGAHRFLPDLFKMEGFSVREVDVVSKPRLSGKSHYGIRNRIVTTLIDLFGVWWLKRRLLVYKLSEKIN
ncbi:MAG: glycosyltransferase family 2 protein [Candidatus Omnitrophica bacterium]|nr:glycosyltransferase family 2 protein [Candidatus Omnitrophota bacterium]